MQLREFAIDDVPDVWNRMAAVGLVSLQTGMDNIRTVVGCPAAGLTPHELLVASPVARRFTDMFVGNREYINLPRKFNVVISGCTENCLHTSNQDVALTPALKEVDGLQVPGFNVAVGGKMGSGGYTPNTPLDLFATPEEAAEICSHIVLTFRGTVPARLATRSAWRSWSRNGAPRSSAPSWNTGPDAPCSGPGRTPPATPAPTTWASSRKSSPA